MWCLLALLEFILKYGSLYQNLKPKRKKKTFRIYKKWYEFKKTFRTQKKLQKTDTIPIIIPIIIVGRSYYTLMTFLMMLSVRLLSMLMILLSILSGIGNLICGNNLHWLLNLNLIYETLWTGPRSGLHVIVSKYAALVIERPDIHFSLIFYDKNKSRISI